MPSLGPISGNMPFSQLFESAKETSGNRWQEAQYCFASFSPLLILAFEICRCDAFLLYSLHETNTKTSILSVINILIFILFVISLLNHTPYKQITAAAIFCIGNYNDLFVYRTCFI